MGLLSWLKGKEKKEEVSSYGGFSLTESEAKTVVLNVCSSMMEDVEKERYRREYRREFGVDLDGEELDQRYKWAKKFLSQEELE